MFKKIICLSLFLTCALGLTFAKDPWGVLNDYEENPTKYAMYKLIKRIPIKYAIEINYQIKKTNTTKRNTDKIGGKEFDEESFEEILAQKQIQMQIQAELQSLIKFAFNTWLHDTKNMIIREKREKEFADIMDILYRGVLLEKTNSGEEDIVFNFVEEKEILNSCGKKALACIFLNNRNPIKILLPPFVPNDTKKLKDLQSLTIHELGHYFALVDQYKDLGDSSLEYGGLSDRLYREDSIMATSLESALGCDDVDGFINIIDITLMKDKDPNLMKNPNLIIESEEVEVWSDRAANGWASFCNGKEGYKDTFYKKGKAVEFI